jgi:hypothetical protein
LAGVGQPAQFTDTQPKHEQVAERRGICPVRIDWRDGTPCSRERFFVGTRKTDDGDAGGIAEEV